jgi:hypothetical protein
VCASVRTTLTIGTQDLKQAAEEQSMKLEQVIVVNASALMRGLLMVLGHPVILDMPIQHCISMMATFTAGAVTLEHGPLVQ